MINKAIELENKVKHFLINRNKYKEVPFEITKIIEYLESIENDKEIEHSDDIDAEKEEKEEEEEEEEKINHYSIF